VTGFPTALWHGFTTDITEQKHNEAALNQAREAAEAASRAKSEFLGVDSAPGQGSTFWFTARFGQQTDPQPIPVDEWADLEGLKVLIAALRDIPYDLVLMDCQMPELDGYEATRRIRAPAGGVLRPTAPIVAMTANAMKGDREKCLEAGMDDYITKPVQLKELAEVLERWLAGGASPADQADRSGRAGFEP
jgi:CheY-like chemotaxis protein